MSKISRNIHSPFEQIQATNLNKLAKRRKEINVLKNNGNPSISCCGVTFKRPTAVSKLTHPFVYTLFTSSIHLNLKILPPYNASTSIVSLDWYLLTDGIHKYQWTLCKITSIWCIKTCNDCFESKQYLTLRLPKTATNVL